MSSASFIATNPYFPRHNRSITVFAAQSIAAPLCHASDVALLYCVINGSFKSSFKLQRLNGHLSQPLRFLKPTVPPTAFSSERYASRVKKENPFLHSPSAPNSQIQSKRRHAPLLSKSHLAKTKRNFSDFRSEQMSRLPLNQTHKMAVLHTVQCFNRRNARRCVRNPKGAPDSSKDGTPR